MTRLSEQLHPRPLKNLNRFKITNRPTAPGIMVYGSFGEGGLLVFTITDVATSGILPAQQGPAWWEAANETIDYPMLPANLDPSIEEFALTSELQGERSEPCEEEEGHRWLKVEDTESATEAGFFELARESSVSDRSKVENYSLPFARLKELAARFPPPPQWYEEDDPF